MVFKVQNLEGTGEGESRQRALVAPERLRGADLEELAAYYRR